MLPTSFVSPVSRDRFSFSCFSRTSAGTLRAAIVRLSTMPVGARPLAAWNRFTAVSRSVPKKLGKLDPSPSSPEAMSRWRSKPTATCVRPCSISPSGTATKPPFATIC